MRNAFVSKIEPFFTYPEEAVYFEQQMYSYFSKYIKYDLKKSYDLCTLQVICDLHIKGHTEVLENIILGNIVWRHDFIKDDVDEVEEIRDYITKPLEVEEGVLICKRCESKRVFSYSKQTRGCDESSTTFAQCAKCGAKWSYSG
jgi:DNA-directed RNA polymerase subunit M/transcription elongation factor TFIIS